MRDSGFKFRNEIFLVVFFTILGKIAVYLAELLIAIKFGASRTTDAFIIARAIPLRIGSIASWSLYSAFVPFYLKVLKKDEGEARILSLVFTKNVLLVSLVVSLGLTLGADLILRMLAPGFEHKSIILSAKLLRVMSGSILFVSLSAVFQSVNASGRHKLVASLSQPFNNLVVLLSLLILGYYMGIFGVALGVLLGSLCQLLIQFVPHSTLERFSLIDKRIEANGDTIKIWKSFLMVSAILLGNESIMMVIRIFASHYEGYVSILNYGYIIAQAPLLFIETLTFYLFYPIFVEHSINPNSDEFRSTVLKFMRAAIFIVAPASMMMFVLSGLISRVLFLHGKFVWDTADMTAKALSFFSLGLLGLVIESIAFRLAIILNRMKEYSFLLLTRLTLNVLLSILLLKYLSLVVALSFSFSLAVVFNAILLMSFIGKAINHRFGLEFLNFAYKVILNSIIAGISVFAIRLSCGVFLRGFLSRLTVLSGALIAGTTVYLSLAHRMKIKEFDILKTIWPKKFIPQVTDV